MLRFLIGRIALTIPVMAVVSFVVFSLLYLTPGDPAEVIAGEFASASDIAALRQQLGLDQPFFVRFGTWVAHVLTGDWQALYDEVAAYREACGDAHLKTILATGELGTLRNVGRASLVCMMAGADFIKTSTGKESVNATLPVSLVMVRAIRDYRERTGYDIGYKPAGGIRHAKQTLAWLALMKDELGVPWTRGELFRFGASSLLADIERQLEHHVTGRYSAAFRHPMA